MPLLTTSAGTSLVAAAVPGWGDRLPSAPPHTIGVALGQGIGPEVVGAALSVLDALGSAFDLSFNLDIDDGIGIAGPHGQSLDDRAAAFYERAFAAGAPVLSGPVGGRFVYEQRARFDLYCKLVPVRPLAALADASIVRPERIDGVDVLIVRDNAGGLYQGGFGRRDNGPCCVPRGRVPRRSSRPTARCSSPRRRRAPRPARGRDQARWDPRGQCVVARAARRPRPRVAMSRSTASKSTTRASSLLPTRAVSMSWLRPTSWATWWPIPRHSFSARAGCRCRPTSGPVGRAVYQTGHGAAYDLAGTDLANPIAQIQSLAMLLRESLELLGRSGGRGGRDRRGPQRRAAHPRYRGTLLHRGRNSGLGRRDRSSGHARAPAR